MFVIFVLKIKIMYFRMEHVSVKKGLNLIVLLKNVKKYVEMNWHFKCNVMMEILIIMMDVIILAILCKDFNVWFQRKWFIVKINNV